MVMVPLTYEYVCTEPVITQLLPLDGIPLIKDEMQLALGMGLDVADGVQEMLRLDVTLELRDPVPVQVPLTVPLTEPLREPLTLPLTVSLTDPERDPVPLVLTVGLTAALTLPLNDLVADDDSDGVGDAQMHG